MTDCKQAEAALRENEVKISMDRSVTIAGQTISHTDIVRFCVITSLTLSSIFITSISLARHIETIYIQLFYFPILYAPFFYPRRGLFLAGFIAVVYEVLAYIYVFPDTGGLIIITGQAILFICIAAVVAYFSEKNNSSELRYREIFDNVSEGIYLLEVTEDGRFKNLEINPALAKSMDIPQGDLIGKYVDETVSPEAGRLVVAKYRRCVESGKIYEEEIELPLPNGNHIFHSSLVPLRNNEGRIDRILGITYDITERRKMEDALRESKNRLEAVIANVPVILFAIDNEMRFTLSEGLGLKKLNLEPNQVMGLRVDDVYAAHPDIITACKETLLGKPQSYQSNVNGIIFDTHTTPLYDDDGKICGLIGIASDITERKRVEDNLIAANQEYTNLLNQIQDIYYRTDTESKLIKASQSWATFLGYDDISECLGKNMADDFYFNPADRKPFIEEIYRHRKVTDYEVRLKKKDGTPVLISTNSHLYYDTAGKKLGVEGTFRDITERKQAEEALRESEEKYRAFFATSMDCVFITSLDGKWVDFNDAAIKFFGYPIREELMDVKIRDLYTNPDDRDAHIRYIREKGYSHEYPVNLRKKDGTFISTLITTVPRKDSDGNIIHFHGTIRDITDRKRAKEALADRLLFQQALIDNIPHPVFIKDATARFVGCNCAYEQVFKTTLDYLQGKTVLDLEYLPLAERRRFHTEDVEVIVSAGRSSYEMPFVYADGLTHMTLYSVDGFRLSDGRPGGLIGMLVDISDRKRMEDALRSVNKKLNMLNSITRHDILNQLMGLLGYLELSKEDVTDPVFLGYIQKEEQAAEAIQAQIEFARNYQDIGAQAQKWQILSDIISSAIRQLKPTSIDIKVNVADVELFADPLIEKVFYNLMENSLRHGDHVTHMDYSVREMKGDLILIYHDDGVGITAEDKKKLFRKGFGKHTGLGLFFSREILSITGITITENGEPGKGARFEITVPKGMWRFAKGEA